MAFVLTLLFIAIAVTIPLAMMWSAGVFVGQKTPSPFITQLIRLAISGCLFLICSVAAVYAFGKYRVDWWGIPLCAVIAGVGISGIVAINTYNSERDANEHEPAAHKIDLR